MTHSNESPPPASSGSDAVPGFAIDLRLREHLLAAFNDTHTRDEVRLTARRALRPGERYRLLLRLPPPLGDSTVDGVVMGVSPGPSDDRFVVDLRIFQAPLRFFERVREMLGLRPPAVDAAPMAPTNFAASGITNSFAPPAPPMPQVAQRLSAGNWRVGGPATPEAPPPGGPAPAGLPPSAAAPVSPFGGSGASGVHGVPVGQPVPVGGFGGASGVSAAELYSGGLDGHDSSPVNIIPANGAAHFSDPLLSASAARRRRDPRFEMFVVGFAKALAHSGLYAGDASSVRKALDDLHAVLRQSMHEAQALIFTRVAGLDAVADLAVEGLPGQTVTETAEGALLSHMMSEGRSSLFIPKIIGFMERRGLVSFGFRPGLTAQEFADFIEAVSAPPTGDTAEKAGTELTAALSERGVTHLVTVFESDLLGLRGRLSSSAQIVLSRLGRELRTTPYFRFEETPEIRALKEGLLRDLLRPIASPDDMRDILLNLDLLPVVEGPGAAWRVDVALIGVLTPAMRAMAAQAIAAKFAKDRDAAAMLGDASWNERSAKYRKTLGLVASSLIESRSPEGDETLKQLQRQRLIGFEDLTPEVRDRLAAGRVADQLVANAPGVLEQLRRVADANAYRQMIGDLRRAVPELVRRGEFVTLQRMLRVAAEHAAPPAGSPPAPFPARPMLARELLKFAASRPTVVSLVAALRTARPERRADIVETLASLGATSAPTLLAALVEAESRPDGATPAALGGAAAAAAISAAAATASSIAANDVARALAAMGKPVVSTLVRTLEAAWTSQTGPAAGTQGTIARRAVALAFGELRETDTVGALSKLAQDPVPDVRDAALRSLARLVAPGNPAAEEPFLRALVDPSPGVKLTALSVLGSLGSVDTRAIEFYKKVLTLGEDGNPDHEAMTAEVCRAIGRLGRLGVPVAPQLETVLLAEIERGRRESTRFKLAAATALEGFVATSDRARRFLERFAQDRDPEVRRRAMDGLSAR